MSRLFLGFLLTTSLVPAQDADLASRAVSLLEQRCFGCHGASLSQSGLRLDSREAALRGGTRGAAIVPGNASGSRAVNAIRRTGELAMPPGPKLPDSEIALVEQWITSGAGWPKTISTNSAQSWWAFQKPLRPKTPALKDTWIRTPVDAFIAQKLSEEKLKPAREADRRTLIRRAIWTCMVCRLARSRSKNSSIMRRPMLTKSSSMSCWRPRAMARNGAGTGSTSRATATPRDSNRTPTSYMRGATAIMSSIRSITTSPTIAS